MVGFVQRSNGRGLKRLTTDRQSIAGAASVDVAGHDAVELTLTGDVTALTWTGWAASTDLHQSVTVTVVQDATGGHAFDPAGVAGTWAGVIPAGLLTGAGDIVTSFNAETNDGGATVTLRTAVENIGYPKVANAAALPTLTADHVGTIYTTIDTGDNYQLKSSDGTTAEWVIWSEAGTVTRENITGAATLDVTGHVGAAAELTLTGDVTSLAFTGWDTDVSKYQKVRVELTQDATGGRAISWLDVVGSWVEPVPDVLPTEANETSLQFYAITTDGGATVWLEPLGVQYEMDCIYMQGVETAVPTVGAGGTVTVGHSFTMVLSVDLFEVATGNHVDATTWAHSVPGDAASPVIITLAAGAGVGEFTVRVAGMANAPCELSTTTDTWETLTLAVTAEAAAGVTIRHSGSPEQVQWIWEPGLAPVNVADNIAVTHTFSSTYTGPVTLRYRKGVNLTHFVDGATKWSFDVAVLPDTIQQLTVVAGGNLLTGDVGGLPKSITSLTVQGSNTLSGNVGNLPPGLITMLVWGSNTIGGDIAAAPAGMTDIRIAGSNTISGNIEAAPAGLTRIEVTGNNTISGDVAGLPAGLITFLIHGNNTIGGNVDGITAPVVTFDLRGSNVTGGDFTALHAGLLHYIVGGDASTASLPGAFTPPAGLLSFWQLGTGLTAAQVGAILVGMDGLGTSNGGSTTPDISLGGFNAAPDAVGATAKTNLQGRGWLVTTN